MEFTYPKRLREECKYLSVYNVLASQSRAGGAKTLIHLIWPITIPLQPLCDQLLTPQGQYRALIAVEKLFKILDEALNLRSSFAETNHCQQWIAYFRWVFVQTCDTVFQYLDNWTPNGKVNPTSSAAWIKLSYSSRCAPSICRIWNLARKSRYIILPSWKIPVLGEYVIVHCEVLCKSLPCSFHFSFEGSRTRVGNRFPDSKRR